MIAAAAVVLVGTGVAAWHLTGYGDIRSEVAASDTYEPYALPLPDRPSIAVLAFDNLSGDPAQEYFSDGIAADIITGLSTISGLFVTARNSSFGYKGKSVDLRDVGRNLGVRYVLEGSVGRVDEDVHVYAQLIDTMTGEHVWSNRLDGSMKDIFAIRGEVIRAIISRLLVTLSESEMERLAQTGTEDAAAYDAFLQGWNLFVRQTPEDNARAVPFFERAIDLDPNYGRPHAALAMVHILATQFAWHEALGRKFNAVWYKAGLHLEDARLRPPTTIYHFAESYWQTFEGHYDDAISQAEQAVALEPNEPSLQSHLGWVLIFSGRAREAIKPIEIAIRLDPETSRYLRVLGIAHFAQERYDTAAEIFEGAVLGNPEYPVSRAWLAAAYAHLGRQEDAEAAMHQYMAEVGYGPMFLRNWGEPWARGNSSGRKIAPWKVRADMDRWVSGLLLAGMPRCFPPGPRCQ